MRERGKSRAVARARALRSSSRGALGAVFITSMVFEARRVGSRTGVRPGANGSGPTLAVVDCQHLSLAPADRLVERHPAGRVLREHVGDDVEIPDLLRGRGGRPWPGRRNRDLGYFGNVPVLRVAPVHWMVGQVVQERHVKAVASFHPLGLVLRLEVKPQKVLGEINVLREIPDADAKETCCHLRSFGPRGVLMWSITSAICFCVPGTRILSLFADSNALIGLWMAMHLPALRQRLLLASSQASTSGSIASV